MTAGPAIEAISLGATLYMPCTRLDLGEALFGTRRIRGLRSAVLCLEDAVLERDVPVALAKLAHFLRSRMDHAFLPGDPLVFVRPRDAGMLDRLLCMPGIECVDGFVIPKAHAESLPAYLSLPLRDRHRLMPTLETREACDPLEMRRLRDQLLAVRERILVLRIGGNDLLQSMGLRRAAGRTAYDGPLGGIIAGLVSTFAPWGFPLSAPVMERFGDAALLREEIERDIEHGLFTKTAIHPDQISIIQDALAVPADQFDEARTVLATNAPAVFARDGVMCEVATHRGWATRILDRAAVFGKADPQVMTEFGRSRQRG